MKKQHLLTNKRGVAIELAISFMLVTFAFCAILLTVAFNTNARTKRVYSMSNDYFTLDQLGEYFVRALEENTTVDFMKDITDENDTNNVRGGWFRYVNTASTTGTAFGLNMSGDGSGDSITNGVYTLRVTYWDDVALKNGKGVVKDEDLLLIVTVRKEGRKYNVVNWSNQLLDVNGAVKDKDPAEDISFLKWLFNLLKTILGAIVAVGETIFKEFVRVITLPFTWGR